MMEEPLLSAGNEAIVREGHFRCDEAVVANAEAIIQ
jgi:hypothetical protein